MNNKYQNAELYKIVNFEDCQLIVGADDCNGIFIYDKSIQNFKKSNDGFIVYYPRHAKIGIMDEDFKKQHVPLTKFIGNSEDEQDRLNNIIEYYFSIKKSFVDQLSRRPLSLRPKPNTSDMHTKRPRLVSQSISWGDICEPPPLYNIDDTSYDDYDYRNEINEYYEESGDYNDSASRSHEDGWFYSDDT